MEEDAILDHAMHYTQYKCYRGELTKDQKRAVRKRATNLVVEKGEVFLKKKDRKVIAYSLLDVQYYTYLIL